MKEYILKTDNLNKTYKSTTALSNVSIQVERGTIYGLIGRNGAGKTTLLKIISGLSFPDSGKVSIFGESINTNSQLLERIGVLIENPGLYPQLNAYENMKLKCIAYGISKKGYIESLLNDVGLGNVKSKKVKNFSLGMKQRLGIALSLVGEPDLLLLDEPTNGLDPQGITEIRNTLLRLSKEKNITIIISSHILGELSKLVSRIGIIEQGRLIEEVSMDELFEKTKEKIEIITNDVAKSITVLEESLNIKKLKVVDNNTIYIYERLNDSGIINKALSDAGVNINSISINRDSLEDYFIDITGGEINA